MVHLTAWGMFLPQKIGRARALEYLIGDKNGPELDVNTPAAGPADGWVDSGGAFEEGVLPASVAGSTALHEAGKKGNTVAVAALLKHGADPLLADSVGRLPLHYGQFHISMMILPIENNDDIPVLKKRWCDSRRSRL